MALATTSVSVSSSAVMVPAPASALISHLDAGFATKVIDGISELGVLWGVATVFANNRENLQVLVSQNSGVCEELYKRFQNLNGYLLRLQGTLAEVPSESRGNSEKLTRILQTNLNRFSSYDLISQMTFDEFDLMIEHRFKIYLQKLPGSDSAVAATDLELAWKNCCQLFAEFKEKIRSGKYAISPELIVLLNKKSDDFYQTIKDRLPMHDSKTCWGVSLPDFAECLTASASVGSVAAADSAAVGSVAAAEITLEENSLAKSLKLFEILERVRSVAQILIQNPSIIYDEVIITYRRGTFTLEGDETEAAPAEPKNAIILGCASVDPSLLQILPDSLSRFVLDESSKLERVVEEIKESLSKDKDPVTAKVMVDLDVAMGNFNLAEFNQTLAEITALKSLDIAAMHLETAIIKKNALKVTVGANEEYLAKVAEVNTAWSVYSDALAEYLVTYDQALEMDTCRSERHDSLIALDRQIEASV